MVLQELQIKADTEGLASITPTNETQWFFTVRCGNCGEERANVGITQEERVAMSGSRGDANLVIKCKLCGRESSVDIKPPVKPYQANGGFQTIVGFDCRGCTLCTWHPRDGFNAETEGGKVFRDIDLSEDWCDYDEDADQPVEISNVEGQFK